MLPLIACYTMLVQHGMRCVLCCDLRGEGGRKGVAMHASECQQASLQTTTGTSKTQLLMLRFKATYLDKCVM